MNHPPLVLSVLRSLGEEECIEGCGKKQNHKPGKSHEKIILPHLHHNIYPRRQY